MPRELFSSSVVCASAVHRGRMLPLSIAVHLGVFATVLALPVVADATFPRPREGRVCVFAPPPLAMPTPDPPHFPATGALSARRAGVAPIITPTVMPTSEPAAPGDLNGEDHANGVAGGVPGGVVGGSHLIAIEPPPAAAQPVRVSSGIRPPLKIRDVRPVYPAIARSARVEGIVILEAVIDERGHVSETRVLRSIPLLDEAAETAVRQWMFSPTFLNGQPVAIVMTVTVQFQLER